MSNDDTLHRGSSETPAGHDFLLNIPETAVAIDPDSTLKATLVHLSFLFKGGASMNDLSTIVTSVKRAAHKDRVTAWSADSKTHLEVRNHQNLFEAIRAMIPGLDNLVIHTYKYNLGNKTHYRYWLEFIWQDTDLGRHNQRVLTANVLAKQLIPFSNRR